MAGEEPEQVELLRREAQLDAGLANLARGPFELDVTELQALCRLVGSDRTVAGRS